MSTWLSGDLKQGLKAAQLQHCQAGRCNMRSLANALVKMGAEYFTSILKLFAATEAIGIPGWVVVHQESSDYVSVSDEGRGTHYYLQANEIAQLITLVNEAVTITLKTGYVDVAASDQDADQLPVMSHALNEYSYESVIHLPINSKRRHFQRVPYWTDARRVFLTGLQLQTLSDRSSDLKGYCAHCLSHRIEGFCVAGRDQRQREHVWSMLGNSPPPDCLLVTFHDSKDLVRKLPSIRVIGWSFF